jgi:hypothetical protein
MIIGISGKIGSGNLLIDNDGTIEELIEKVKEILIKEKII